MIRKLNFALNTLNGNVMMRVTTQDIQPDGCTVLSNFNRFFDRTQIAMLATSDPTWNARGDTARPDDRLRDQSCELLYDVGGIQWSAGKELEPFPGSKTSRFCRQPFATTNDRILIMPQDGQSVESGVSHNQRVSQFGFEFNRPGRMCFKTDDMFETDAPGPGQDSRDVGHAASTISTMPKSGSAREELFPARISFQSKRGPLERSAGLHRDERSYLVPAISLVSCMDCHQTGDSVFLGAGESSLSISARSIRIISQRECPPGETVFRNQFGQQLRHSDFFTTNVHYRQVADEWGRRTRLAQQMTDSVVVDNAGKPVGSMPKAVNDYNAPLTVEKAAREFGFPATVSPSSAAPTPPESQDVRPRLLCHRSQANNVQNPFAVGAPNGFINQGGFGEAASDSAINGGTPQLLG